MIPVAVPDLRGSSARLRMVTEEIMQHVGVA